MRLLLIASFLLVACSSASRAIPTSPGGPPNGGARVELAAQKSIVIGYTNEPNQLDPGFGVGGGNADFSALFSGFLAYLTPQQQPMPYLAQELPDLQRGTWKLLTDGRMETTYKLNRSATWHDGTQITAHDFVFAHTVRTDPAVPVTYANVERQTSVRALDDYTLVLEWSEPYIYAGMIPPAYFAPLPNHILANLYANDKKAFIEGPHWREQFVGSGPYRLESWVPGVEMVARAHEGFVFGKPPVDRVIFKFIADPKTIVANLLAGNINAAFHNSIGFEQNRALERAGWDGTTEYWRGNPRFLQFQMRDWGNLVPAVLDIRVRRALLHAIDRQGLVDELYAGKARVQHFWLDSSDPAFPAVDRAVTKYDYDPTRAEALLREAGWTRGSDGVARNANGEMLHLPLLTTPEEPDWPVVLDNWKAVGASSELLRLTPAQLRNGEFRSKFPAVSIDRRGMDIENMVWTTPRLSLPENRWAGQDRNGYVNPVVDALWPRVLTTIDPREHETLLVEALSAMTNDAVVTPLYLQPRVMSYARGLQGPKETWVGETAMMWNIWEWQWTS